MNRIIRPVAWRTPMLHLPGGLFAVYIGGPFRVVNAGVFIAGAKAAGVCI